METLATARNAVNKCQVEQLSLRYH